LRFPCESSLEDLDAAASNVDGASPAFDSSRASRRDFARIIHDRHDRIRVCRTAGCRELSWQQPRHNQPALAQQAELKRQHFEARAHYEAAYQHANTAPAQATVARHFADTLLSWGEFADAQTQLELVVLHQPNQAAGWHDLGMVRHRLGLPAGAEVALRRAVTLAPTEPRPRIALAALFWANHRPADALREYQALRHLALPAAIRSKVDWAIAELSRPATATPPATP
jgi:Flp pilus assembly protein TadD